MYNNFDRLSTAYIKIFDNKVTEVGELFLKLTKYEKHEIVNKDISYVLHNLLRIYNEITDYEQNQKSFFIFTKDLFVREVNIAIKDMEDDKLIFFNEIPNSRVEEILPHVYIGSSTEKTGVVVYSVPDLILIKANQTYLDFLGEPYNKLENSIGKRIHEIYKDYIGSDCEKNITNLIYKGEVTFGSDVVHYGQSGKTDYWDVCLMPIYQYGKLKYVVENYQNVTERVLYQKQLEEQIKGLLREMRS